MALQDLPIKPTVLPKFRASHSLPAPPSYPEPLSPPRPLSHRLHPYPLVSSSPFSEAPFKGPASRNQSVIIPTQTALPFLTSGSGTLNVASRHACHPSLNKYLLGISSEPALCWGQEQYGRNEQHSNEQHAKVTRTPGEAFKEEVTKAGASRRRLMVIAGGRKGSNSTQYFRTAKV